MKSPFSRPGRSGATAVEYGVIAGLIGVAIVLGAATLGSKISAALDGASDRPPFAGEILVDAAPGG